MCNDFHEFENALMINEELDEGIKVSCFRSFLTNATNYNCFSNYQDIHPDYTFSGLLFAFKLCYQGVNTDGHAYFLFRTMKQDK